MSGANPGAVRQRRLENLELGNDKRWRGNLAVPEHAHPLVRQFFLLANHRQALLKEISDRAGFNRSTMDGWRREGNPNLLNFEAALNALGYELRIVQRQGQ